jgi:hypothetical protein
MPSRGNCDPSFLPCGRLFLDGLVMAVELGFPVIGQLLYEYGMAGLDEKIAQSHRLS